MKMKIENKRKLTIVSILLYLAGLFTVNLYALDVSFLIGDVQILRNGKTITPEVGKSVQTGDLIITQTRGLIVLQYGDGSQLNIQEKSKIKIGTVIVKGKKEETISVVAGVVKCKFGKLLKGRKLYTPTTVASIRGTTFELAVSDGADSRVKLDKGKIQVKNPYGKVDLKNKGTADVGVGDKPEKNDKSGSYDQWKKKKDAELDNDPAKKGEKFKSYMNKFQERSSKASNDVDKFDKKVKSGDKTDLNKTAHGIQHLSRNVEDDMMMNEAANNAIGNIMNRYKDQKAEMYNIFLKIKEESNKVLEQQKKNYEAIQAVREAYKKAYGEIMNKHKSYMDQIRGKYKKNKKNKKQE